MPPRGGTSMPAAGERTARPELPEFITNDLYGGLVAEAIKLGGEALNAAAHADGRHPGVADQVAQQMVTRAARQLVELHEPLAVES